MNYLLLLQEGPAQTTGYMIAGYVVIFGVMLIYLASLYLRNRNLKSDLEMLQELEEKERRASAGGTAAHQTGNF